MENGEEYINALDQAINDEEIRNIAITAPYGAGKSSVIKTYVKKHPSLKYTFISMATFNSNEGNSQEDKKNEEIPLEKIENVILKQFFYKVKKNMLPQSRYNKIEKMSYMYIFIWTFCVNIFCLHLQFITYLGRLQGVLSGFLIFVGLPHLSQTFRPVLVHNDKFSVFLA